MASTAINSINCNNKQFHFWDKMCLKILKIFNLAHIYFANNSKNTRKIKKVTKRITKCDSLCMNEQYIQKTITTQIYNDCTQMHVSKSKLLKFIYLDMKHSVVYTIRGTKLVTKHCCARESIIQGKIPS